MNSPSHSSSLNGIIPAIVSPCDEGSRFDEQRFHSLAIDLLSRGADGLYVCGLTGEGYQMNVAERKLAVELAVSAAHEKNGAILAHIGTQDTRTACDLAEHAACAGVCGIASIPPFSRPFREIESYYRQVAATVPGLSIFIYHIPVFTKWEPSLEEFRVLLGIDGVTGIKFTDYNLLLMRRLLALQPAVKILYGRDEQLAPALAYGASGGVGTSYNILPEAFSQIWKAARAGDWPRAFFLQNIVVDLFVVFEKFGVMASNEALLKVAGQAARVRRKPCAPVADKDASKLLHEIAPILARLPADCQPANLL